MRIVRLAAVALLLLVSLFLHAWAGEYRLANGNTLRGEIASADEDGLVVRLDVGGYSPREPWVSFAQQTLRELATNPKYTAFVEPFIELAPEELKAMQQKQKVLIRPVEGRPERPPARPGMLSGFTTPFGLFVLAVLMAANLYGAYEVARFRNRPTVLVCGLSAVLPLFGPILFLLIPTETAAPAPEPSDEAATAAALTVPTGADKGGGGGLSLASSEKSPAASAAAQPQIFQRGENTFNRRFFETKFPGFFRVVLGEAERDLVIVIRTPKTEYIGKRISRISSNELHLVLLSSNAETSITFAEITSVILKHKDAKV